ncbi:MAG: hypothetical protein ACP6IQ_01960 [Candidatus Njordarchaeia archaeon]
MEYIEIHGNTVTLYEKTPIKHVELNDFLNALSKRNIKHSGILPLNCIWITEAGENAVYVVELPPKLLTILYKNATREADGEAKKYKISLPFLQFYFAFKNNGEIIKNIYLSCTKTPIESEDDIVYACPLPNIYNGGKGALCTGDMESVTPETPIALKIKKLINGFFNSEFNTDLLPMSYLPDILRPPRGKHFIEVWQELSKKNRLFGVSDEIEYQPIAHFGKRIERIIDNEF